MKSIVSLSVLSLALSSVASATEFHLYPDCDGRPRITVPEALQGTFYGGPTRHETDEFVATVTADGIASNRHQFKTEWPMGSKKIVTLSDEDLIKQGYCKYSEVATDPDGTLYLTTTLSFSRTSWWGHAQSNADFRIYYHPDTQAYGASDRSNGFALIFFFMPSGSGSGYPTERPIFKVAN